MKMASALFLSVALMIVASSHLASGQVRDCSYCNARLDNQIVCANGQNYANLCYAQCYGQTSYTVGLCGSNNNNNFFNRAGNNFYNYYPSYNRFGYPFNYFGRSPYYQNQYYYYNQYPYNYNNGNGQFGSRSGNCNCPSNYSPVCALSRTGNSRDTYLNFCVANCLGARIISNTNC